MVCAVSMRRKTRPFSKPAAYAGVILLLVVAGLAVVSTITSVSIPLSTERVSRLLRQHHLNYDVNFDQAWIKWDIQNSSFELSFENFELFGLGRDKVSAFPTLTVTSPLSSLTTSGFDVLAVAIVEPDIRIVWTAGGALKIDIGETTNGSAGSIVSEFLIELAAFSGQPGEKGTPPRLLIKDASLMLGDEISGAEFQFESAATDLQSHRDGVRGRIELEARLYGENLRITTDGLFRTIDHSYSTDTRFSNLNPAILADLLPNLLFFAPVEIALSGRVEAELDRHLMPRSAKVKAHGAEGSLEVAPYGGRNIKLQALDIKGSVSVSDDQAVFEDWSIGWSDAKLTGMAIYANRKQAQPSIELDVTLSDQAWSYVAPRWFSQLERYVPHATDGTGAVEGLRQRLMMIVSSDAGNAVLGGGALLSFEPLREADSDAASATRRPLIQVFGLELDGSISSPRVNLAKLAETDDLAGAFSELCTRLGTAVPPLSRAEPGSGVAAFPGLSNCPASELSQGTGTTQAASPQNAED